MEKYIVNGKYSASNNDFIYYESGNNCFCANMKFDGSGVEVYQGNKDGDGDYYDLPLSAKEELLKICDNSSSNTRALMKYVRANDLNKKEETKNGLGVKMKLTNENSFSLLAKFKRQAIKQGYTMEEVKPILDKATSGSYENLICVLADNIAY